jgi:hypothetical protein
VIVITAEPSGLIVTCSTLGETVEIDLPVSELVKVIRKFGKTVRSRTSFPA